MSRIVKRRSAELDLDREAAYFQEKQGPNLAIRFLEAVDKAMQLLAEMPTLGSVWETESPDFADAILSDSRLRKPLRLLQSARGWD